MKQQLSEALDPGRRTYGWLTVLEDAARLVERLLPGECETCGGSGSMHEGSDSEPYEGQPCPVCHGSGRVWDEGIVEAVAKALPDSEHFSTDEDYHQAARIVLSAIAQLAEAGSQ